MVCEQGAAAMAAQPASRAVSAASSCCRAHALRMVRAAQQRQHILLQHRSGEQPLPIQRTHVKHLIGVRPEDRRGEATLLGLRGLPEAGQGEARVSIRAKDRLASVPALDEGMRVSRDNDARDARQRAHAAYAHPLALAARPVHTAAAPQHTPWEALGNSARCLFSVCRAGTGRRSREGSLTPIAVGA